MERKIKVKQILRLRAQAKSQRAIATSHGVARNSVAEVFHAADAAGKLWEEHAGKTDEPVYQLLFPGRAEHEGVFVQPDWAQVHKELAKVGVTLKLLHAEYTEAHHQQAGAATMGYDRFCKTYQKHVLEYSGSSRVEHKSGMSFGVNRSGPNTAINNPITGAKSSTFYLIVPAL